MKVLQIKIIRNKVHKLVYDRNKKLVYSITRTIILIS